MLIFVQVLYETFKTTQASMSCWKQLADYVGRGEDTLCPFWSNRQNFMIKIGMDFVTN